MLFPLTFYVARSIEQRLLLTLPLLLLLIVELLNSAVENAVDRIGHEHHDLLGNAKDMGSAAVPLCLVMTILCWGAIAWKNFV